VEIFCASVSGIDCTATARGLTPNREPQFPQNLKFAGLTKSQWGQMRVSGDAHRSHTLALIEFA
jgi:hypothetical protein